jgi:hypothetical protein
MCPALGHQICAVCCGTKRLVEIRCPADCAYLTSAREHPAAAVMRRQQRDVGLLVEFMRDLSERQSQLFLLIGSFLVRYNAPELQGLVDEDVEEAAAALASTFETSVRGVIYEHRAPSLSGERLVGALKPVLAEAGARAGTPFERDAAVVLRRFEEAVRQVGRLEPDNRRALVDVLGRVVRRTDAEKPPEGASAARDDAPRLILP